MKKHSDSSKKSLHEQYIEMSKDSLIKVQYSCSGISTPIGESENIPIVPENLKPAISVTYTEANEDHVPEIVALLKSNQLPVSDLGSGKRIFLVAECNQLTVGCVAVEFYRTNGLLRSLAVRPEFRGRNIGKQLVFEAEKWALNNGIHRLFLLSTTAASFFDKLNWYRAERTEAPSDISSSTEFSSVCPSTAIFMQKAFN